MSSTLIAPMRRYGTGDREVDARVVLGCSADLRPCDAVFSSLLDVTSDVHLKPTHMATMAANIHESGHPLIMHKITQMRKAAARPKYLHTLIKEVSTFLCYEATKDLPLEACDVQTLCGAERGLRIAQRVGVVPVLRGGLGMVEAMTEFCSNAQVWHLGIYRDKKSLLPVEYYNKLPKRITVQTVFVLDPMPMSGATAVAAMDILKAWGSSVPGAQLRIKFVCLGASEKALAYISESHPDVDVHVGLIDRVQVAARARRRPRAARAAPAPHRPTDRTARRDARRTRRVSRSSRCSPGWATSATASSAPSPTTPCRPTERWTK